MESHFERLSFMFMMLFSIAYATTPCEFPAIFSFGDSNIDTGGYSKTFGQGIPPRPYGESYFGGPKGRYSDGRLIIDFIAENLGLPYLTANLDSVGSNFTHGANFATSGISTIRPGSKAGPISLNYQTYQFRDFHESSKRICNQGVFSGLIPKPEDFSRALYVMDIGQNDLIIDDFVGMPKHNFTTNIASILRQFKKSFQNIYESGGRSFWIHNVGPIGCLTSIVDKIPITKRQVDKVGCSIPHNNVVQYYNRGLKDAVVQLRKDYPLAAVTYVDIYTVKYTLFTQADEQGFENPLQVCCGRGGKYNYSPNNPCGSNVTENGKQVHVGKCEDPSAWINWDGTHYTEAANKWMFDQIVDGSFSDPPIPLEMACHRQH